MSQIDQYAVIGNPIAHSKSPFIHTAFARQTAQELEYVALEVPLDGFVATINGYIERGMKGVNVTVPFKEEAWQIADERSSAAELAGAVNTLLFREDGNIYGDNTDGSGLLRDLQHNLKLRLSGKRLLILGAGGAVRGVLKPLLGVNPESVFIANRTATKAVNLATEFDAFGPVRAGGFNDIDQTFDLIINATAASLQGDMPELPAGCLSAGGACYDMMYAKEPTVFLRWGQQQGAASTADGLGMLVEQAADAFAIWRGVRPETATVLTGLRQLMSG